MGIMLADFSNGVDGDYKIVKKRGFEKIKDGEKVDSIKYIKTKSK
jgi:hypothetical protein